MAVALFISWFLMTGVVHAAAGSKADAKALFEKKCIQCHTLDRATTTKKTQAEWKDTVMRMKNVNGAPITDEQAKTIIEYLTENYGK